MVVVLRLGLVVSDHVQVNPSLVSLGEDQQVHMELPDVGAIATSQQST